jgi:hypothetical protein
MRHLTVFLGVLFLASWAGAQVTPIVVVPDSSNTNRLTACEVSQGFHQLMDGTRASLAANFRNAGGTATSTLSTSWRDTLFSDTNNGVGTRAVYKTGQSATDITTRRLIANFDVRMAFRNTDNSGFFYRGKESSNPPWNTAVEVGIDNTHSRVPREQTGGVFDIFPPVPAQSQTTFLYNSNRWNEIRIIAIGDSIQHWVNGIKVADYKVFSTAYFSGVGTVAGVTTGYNQSKWNAGKQMSFEVANNQGAGPILRGILGVQGAHPGNMLIRNFRVDTIPSWAENGANYPDTVSSCGVVAVGKPVNAPASALRVSRLGNNVSVMIPGGSLREAALVDVFGRVQAVARIDGQHAVFGNVGNGVYFLRYRDMNGMHSARVGVVGIR